MEGFASSTGHDGQHHLPIAHLIMVESFQKHDQASDCQWSLDPVQKELWDIDLCVAEELLFLYKVSCLGIGCYFTELPWLRKWQACPFLSDQSGWKLA